MGTDISILDVMNRAEMDITHIPSPSTCSMVKMIWQIDLDKRQPAYNIRIAQWVKLFMD